MAQRNSVSTNSASTTNPGASLFPLFAGSYVSAFRDSQERMERLQHQTRILQETLQEESTTQLQEFFDAMTRISRALDKATRENSVAGLAGAQPEVMECMMAVTRNGNRGLLRVAGTLQDCTLELASMPAVSLAGDTTAESDPAASSDTDAKETKASTGESQSSASA